MIFSPRVNLEQLWCSRLPRVINHHARVEKFHFRRQLRNALFGSDKRLEDFLFDFKYLSYLNVPFRSDKSLIDFLFHVIFISFLFLCTIFLFISMLFHIILRMYKIITSYINYPKLFELIYFREPEKYLIRNNLQLNTYLLNHTSCINRFSKLTNGSSEWLNSFSMTIFNEL